MINNEILNGKFDCNLAGSTLILTLIHRNKLYTGNVGDSRAVLGQKLDGITGWTY
jgi:serine/threonine protein phosphatase PrpC